MKHAKFLCEQLMTSDDDDAILHVDQSEEAGEMGSDTLSAEELASGFVKIAVENMANAIKKVSVQRGYDVGE